VVIHSDGITIPDEEGVGGGVGIIFKNNREPINALGLDAVFFLSHFVHY